MDQQRGEMQNDHPSATPAKIPAIFMHGELNPAATPHYPASKNQPAARNNLPTAIDATDPPTTVKIHPCLSTFRSIYIVNFRANGQFRGSKLLMRIKVRQSVSMYVRVRDCLTRPLARISRTLAPLASLFLRHL